MAPTNDELTHQTVYAPKLTGEEESRRNNDRSAVDPVGRNRLQAAEDGRVASVEGLSDLNRVLYDITLCDVSK